MFAPVLLAFAVGLATPSDALPPSGNCSCFEQFLDWFDEQSVEDEILPYAGPAVINASSLSPDDFQNSYVLECTYAGSTRYIVFPLNASDSLMIDDNGNLLNVGSVNVVGQMLNTNGSLQYDAYYVTVYPITTSSFSSQLYQHGSYIQLAHYYQSYYSGGYRLTNDSNYVTLTNCKRYHSTALSSRQWLYVGVAVLLIFSIFGAVGSLVKR